MMAAVSRLIMSALNAAAAGMVTSAVEPSQEAMFISVVLVGNSLLMLWYAVDRAWYGE